MKGVTVHRAAPTADPAGTTRPTIITVAQAAGVSRQTVSNVLRGQGRFSTEVAQRVHAAAEQLGYQPNVAARQLRSKSSNAIGVRMDHDGEGLGNAVLDRFLHMLAIAARAEGLRLALYTTEPGEDETREMDEALTTLDLDGFVLHGTHHGDERAAWLTARAVPFVAFGRPWGAGDPHQAPHSWVDVRGDTGSDAAVRHLAELGHRRIAFVGWPTGSGIGDERRKGWRRALADLDLPEGPIYQTEDGFDGGATAYRALSATADPPTAYVCVSDSIGLGVLEAARLEHGTASTPIAVVGCDDPAAARAVGMTSIRHPMRATAVQVMTLLKDRITHPDHEPQHVLLDPRIVIRASTTSTHR